MRKLILVLSIFTVVLTSCSSDDDGGYQDSFLGSWKYFKSFEDGEEFALEDCEDLIIFDILSNGTFMITNHSCPIKSKISQFYFLSNCLLDV
jgi:hypothetical protein